MTFRSTFLGAVSLVAALATPIIGRQAAPSAPAPGLISIDFEAIGSDGTPITDLKPEQVSLKIDGRAHDVRSLQLVTLENGSTADPNALIPPPLPFGTNVAVSGDSSRAIIVVIEDESLLPGKETAMRQALGQMVARLGPRDRISLVTVPHGGMKLDFTTDKNKFIEALGKVGGQASLSGGGDSDPYCRTRNTLQALTGMLDDLSVGAVGPSTVILFSNSLMGPSPQQQIRTSTFANPASPIGTCQLDVLTFQQLGDAAAAARANFYIVQPDDTGYTPQQREGLENVAGETGGRHLSVNMHSELALSPINTETSAYYVVTFAPEPSERNGLPHSVGLKVARDGVNVRARPRVVIPKAGTALPPAVGKAPLVMPATMVRESRAFRELPLRVSGYVSRRPGEQKLMVVGVMESIDPTASLSAASAGLFDSSGHLAAQWSARPEDVQTSQVKAGMLVAPGKYRLRMAATDSSGRGGAAECDVDVELVEAGGLKLSSLVLGLSRNNAFLPKLQFGGEATAIGQLEMYGRVNGQISVMLEVSSSLNGPALTAMPLAVSATEETDKFVVRGVIPIGALPTGDYVVRIVVEVPGQAAGRVIRTLRKVSI